MQIGGALTLFALGAIMAFAVRDAIDGINLQTTGYILMGVGALGLLLTLLMNSTRERRVRDRRDDVPPPAV